MLVVSVLLVPVDGAVALAVLLVVAVEDYAVVLAVLPVRVSVVVEAPTIAAG